VHYFAVLIGAGATTVNAYLAQESIADRHRRGLFGNVARTAVARYKKAVDKGLLKIMSKMGIGVISSYRGGMNFEAIGLSPRAGRGVLPRHAVAHLRHRPVGHRAARAGAARQGLGRGWCVALPVGGLYKLRRRGEVHAFDGSLIHTLQKAVETDSYQTYKRYTDGVRKLPPVALRDLLDFRTEGRAVALEEVESITEIRKRFVAPGISLGALSPRRMRRCPSP
jgi:glutamate synthase (NADPH) large chain